MFLNDLEARERINDRLRRAQAPRLPVPPGRHRLAHQLRRFAARLEN
ncbi:hypothetical protein NOCA2220007 [metagenome]|uniref:Uncharacterized protein n=1 Tax=metagenome TaxID=256318 RepID=A0A2P2BYI9_9ZZZZ